MKTSKLRFHFLTILLIGTSATMWAVYERKFQMPFFWLLFLSLWIIINSPTEFKMFFRRLVQIGSLLSIVSLIQIIFRRQGMVLFSIEGFPIIFSEGFREATLLWIRFMILFMLAFIFSQVSLFEFLLFLNKIGISLQLSLLLLTTLKFIPFIFDEAKRGIWTIRFRGVDFGSLRLRGKYQVLKKLLIPILFRGVHYVSFSALALELRGYGVTGRIKIPQTYPLRAIDFAVLSGVLVINLYGIFVIGK